ncbi:formate dehydrogenase formation protein fdhe [hydrocarbon metagenome]|uniref:Formate dehydrogenase formation protein fdhe n=1 Tax=hydrocarbon metagenome TaxID=938273 RepID=A0A0W8G3Q7_9ZZZZ
MNPDLEREKTLISKKTAVLASKSYFPEPLLGLVSATLAMQLAAKDAILESGSGSDLDDMPVDVEKALRGACLFPRERFDPDRTRAMDLLASLADWIRRSDTPLAAAMLRIDAAQADGRFDPMAAMNAHIAGDDTFFQALETLTPEAPRLPAFLVQAALAPGLEVIGSRIYAKLPKDRSWTHGHCPVCGSPPLHGRLVGKEGARHLTCSFCHVEYRARRLMCPFCGEDDAKKLDYFSTPDEPGYRVETCAACQRYIKTTDFREFDRPSYPLLDDLESLALDMAVQKMGFTRPVLSAWGF